jgi:hypothetical protein
MGIDRLRARKSRACDGALLVGLLVLGMTAAPGASARTKAPAITVKCLVPGGRVPQACATVARGTTLVVTAGRDLPAGTRLRFHPLGAGGPADVALGSGQLRRGQAVRLAVPPQLCAGRSAGSQVQFEIQVATSDFQSAENVGSQKGRSQFEIQVATSDLQNAENVSPMTLGC